MNKIEPIEATPSLSDIIKDTPINGEIQIHADRVASFKSTVNRVNSQLTAGDVPYKYSYTGVKNDYATAKRIA